MPQYATHLLLVHWVLSEPLQGKHNVNLDFFFFLLTQQSQRATRPPTVTLLSAVQDPTALSTIQMTVSNFSLDIPFPFERWLAPIEQRYRGRADRARLPRSSHSQTEGAIDLIQS